MASIHRTTSTITVTEPHQYIQTMFASARRFHPDCRAVVLSDQATRFPPRADIDIIRYELDAQQPMLARSIAWLAYLRAARGHTVFLDSDLLINGDLSHIFAVDFAAALTYRDGDSKWPINAGVNFAHGDHLSGRGGLPRNLAARIPRGAPEAERLGRRPRHPARTLRRRRLRPRRQLRLAPG